MCMAGMFRIDRICTNDLDCCIPYPVWCDGLRLIFAVHGVASCLLIRLACSARAVMGYRGLNRAQGWNRRPHAERSAASTERVRISGRSPALASCGPCGTCRCFRALHVFKAVRQTGVVRQNRIVANQEARFSGRLTGPA